MRLVSTYFRVAVPYLHIPHYESKAVYNSRPGKFLHKSSWYSTKLLQEDVKDSIVERQTKDSCEAMKHFGTKLS